VERTGEAENLIKRVGQSLNISFYHFLNHKSETNMKRSNLFLGASAFILALAGAFATKAAKSNHQHTVFTKGVKGNAACHKHLLKSGLTLITSSGHTLLTGTSSNITAFTGSKSTVTPFLTSCGVNTLFTRSDT